MKSKPATGVLDQDALAFIASLAARSAGTDLEQTWYCLAACAFAACNQASYVAEIYKVAVRSHQDDIDFQKTVLHRIKESLLKTGVIFGIPRLINAIRSLIAAVPSPELHQTSSPSPSPSPSRRTLTPSQADARGLPYMRNIFRADLDPFLALMDAYCPDLRALVVTTVYGVYQSDVGVLDAVTTSQLNIATLVPMDVPAEVAWHMRGTVRNGGSVGQLEAAYGVAVEVCRICGVVLRNEMPRPEDVVEAERLF